MASTYPSDRLTPDQSNYKIMWESEKIRANDLQRKGYVGRTIGVKVRYGHFKIVTRDHTIAEPTQNALAIRRAAGACLKRVPLDRRIRLLGVRVSGLRPVTSATVVSQSGSAERSISLFDL